MAQAMIIKKLFDKSTQTGDLIEYFQLLAPTKSVHFRFSSKYKDYVLCFHFSNNKKYIITRSMWLKFRNKLPLIEYVYRNIHF